MNLKQVLVLAGALVAATVLMTMGTFEGEAVPVAVKPAGRPSAVRQVPDPGAQDAPKHGSSGAENGAPATFKCPRAASNVEASWAGPASKYRCTATTVGPLQKRGADLPPQCCAPIDRDVDYGKTLGHLVSRLMCHTQASAAAAGEECRTLRVAQVGANTGDNANDHIVKILRLGVAHAVLMEPVPWIFKKLEKTYANYRKTVMPLNAAMALTDGNVTFTAPREGAPGWKAQMGGLELPKKTADKIKKKGWQKYFEQITVRGLTFKSLMDNAGWGQSLEAGAADPPVDVLVVDAEGYDATVLGMVFDAIAVVNPTLRIPIVQYEWKHLTESSRSKLKARLVGMGYCVLPVHYDEIAYIPAALGLNDGAEATCTKSYLVEAST